MLLSKLSKLPLIRRLLQFEVKNIKTRNFVLKNLNYSNFPYNFQLSIKMSSDAKKFKENMTIGTHDGIFHCDEALACFMLQQLPEYENATIIRSRDENILKDCDVVVDVGGVFDVETKRYDHHQKTFQHTLSTLKPECGTKWTIKLSSAGLIYTFYGEKIIKYVLKKYKDIDIEPNSLKVIYKKIYEKFIQEIDAIDNGVPMYDGEPLYTISTNLSARTGNFNPQWNSKETLDIQQQFEKAKNLAGGEFLDKIFYYTLVWWPARSIVQNAIENRFKVYESGEILELAEFCPWKEHLFGLEQDNNIVGIPKFVIIENKPNDWRVISVPVQPTSFVCRKFIHKDWRGVRDNELAELCGIKTAGFVHATGFIGGCKTREDALEMATKSLLGDYTD